MEEQNAMEQCNNIAPKNEEIFGEEFVYAALTATIASTFAIVNFVQYVA